MFFISISSLRPILITTIKRIVIDIDKIKYIRLLENNNLSEKIPFTTDAVNVEMENEENLENTIQEMKENINSKINKTDIIDNLNST